MIDCLFCNNSFASIASLPALQRQGSSLSQCVFLNTLSKRFLQRSLFLGGRAIVVNGNFYFFRLKMSFFIKRKSLYLFFHDTGNPEKGINLHKDNDFFFWPQSSWLEQYSFISNDLLRKSLPI